MFLLLAVPVWAQTELIVYSSGIPVESTDEFGMVVLRIILVFGLISYFVYMFIKVLWKDMKKTEVRERMEEDEGYVGLTDTHRPSIEHIGGETRESIERAYSSYTPSPTSARGDRLDKDYYY